jgi:hypothetical protein
VNLVFVVCVLEKKVRRKKAMIGSKGQRVKKIPNVRVGVTSDRFLVTYCRHHRSHDWVN